MPVKRAEKTPMPARDAGARAHDFLEVNQGYNLFRARFEAERCRRCQDAVLRMGAEAALIVYRRSENEMTARDEEYHHAIEEGVRFHWLTNPVAVLGNPDGWVIGLECRRMQLGEPDDSGRARPVAVAGSEFVIPVDNVVLSIGNAPNPLLLKTTEGLRTDRRGCLVVDAASARTSRPRVWAGGDIVTGAATVILAAGAGKDAAKAIHLELSATGA